jgi:hypothetical protein
MTAWSLNVILEKAHLTTCGKHLGPAGRMESILQYHRKR